MFCGVGDSAPGFKSGNNIAVIEALDGADLLWQTYGLAIQKLCSQDPHHIVVEQFLQLKLKVLTH